ncbi:TIGR03086 family protein [Streptomyces piniterrae]|uniref:TIGR03086 family protein n=2 Tax=Streptomyces piniterrae TaxID=2571125 RepID=A0A4U0NK82_9ACTN|nr:TIGR03086 family protein [Streptomyces piniterrae]
MSIATEVVSRVRPDQLGLPTPCAAWDLGQLLAHMVGQNHGFAAVARGETSDASVFADRPVGEDPGADFAASARDVVAAFNEEGVTERKFWLPEIRDGIMLPATTSMGFHFIDYVVHSWDVAASLGRSVEFDADILARSLPIAEAVPGGKAREAADSAFAPILERPDLLERPQEATTLDRILALLGRSPEWPSVAQ